MRKQVIATLAYCADFAYAEMNTDAITYRGQRSIQNVAVVSSFT